MEESYKILIVDDEKDLCEILQFNLESEGYTIDIAHSGEEALNKPIHEFDLILIDVMMGGMTGYKLANIIRKELKLSTHIIFLTAKGEENDILTGFNVGADDYLIKPFSIKEMIARIRAILKRGHKQAGANTVFKVEGLEIDIDSKTITIDKEAINLTRKEFEILSMLLKHEGQYIGRNEILDRIWSDNVIVTERNVDVNIARLRKKIGSYGKYIKGKSGYGYAFKS